TASERQALDGIYYEKFGKTYSAEVQPSGSWKEKKIMETTDAEGNKRKFGYNDKGELNSVIDEHGKTWTTQDGKTWTTAGPDGRTWKGTITVTKDGTYKEVNDDGTLNVEVPAKDKVIQEGRWNDNEVTAYKAGLDKDHDQVAAKAEHFMDLLSR